MTFKGNSLKIIAKEVGKIKTCCFLGHRNCTEEIFKTLLYKIEELIIKENVKCFYVGTQGAFDSLVFDALCLLEAKYDIKTVVVLAYLNNEIAKKYLNSAKTIFPEELTKIPLRFAIRRRNSYMIEKSDYIISYINTPISNVFSSVEEAVKKKKHIINIGAYNLNNIVL